MLLEKIEQSSDIKKLKAEDYPVLAQRSGSFCWKRSAVQAVIWPPTWESWS